MARETKPVAVYVAQGRLAAEVIRAKLESFGIPAILQYDSALAVCPVTVDGLGEVRVLVPEPLADEARRVIEEPGPPFIAEEI